MTSISISGQNISVSTSPLLLHYHFRIPKQNIVYFRYILEGYEGLGIQSTKAGSDIVTWSFPENRKKEIERLLFSMFDFYKIGTMQ